MLNHKSLTDPKNCIELKNRYDGCIGKMKMKMKNKIQNIKL